MEEHPLNYRQRRPPIPWPGETLGTVEGLPLSYVRVTQPLPGLQLHILEWAGTLYVAKTEVCRLLNHTPRRNISGRYWFNHTEATLDDAILLKHSTHKDIISALRSLGVISYTTGWITIYSQEQIKSLIGTGKDWLAV